MDHRSFRDPQLSCHVEVRADGVHLIVSGDLDHQTCDGFDRAVRAVLTGAPSSLVLDLTAVRFISAQGTAALVDGVHRAAEICAAVAVLPSPAVRRRLELLGLDLAVDIGPLDETEPPAASA
jgi:anti-anti-sigma factor